MPVSRLRQASLVGLCLLAGCRADAPRAFGDSPERGGTVVVAASTDLGNLNGLVSSEKWGQDVIRNVLFLPLVEYDDDLEIQPRLARAFELLGDTGVVFRLHEDLRWHDGAPTTAEDVAFSFRRAKDPATAFPNSAFFTYWTDVEVIDELTVRFRFEPHVDPLAGLPFFPIMPRHLLDTVPPARLREARFNRAPVGNGPFRFVEYRPNDRWVFEANPEFPEELGGRPNIDRLVWRIVPEPAAQITEIRTGAVDLILNARPDQVRGLDADAGFRLIERRARQYAFVGWNGRRPPLDDPRVRRALTLAIDRQRMVDALRVGFGEPAAGPIGPFHWSYDTSLAPLPHDPEAARALLRQAGIEDRTGDGMLQLPDGSVFTVELKIPAGHAGNRDMAELMRHDLSVIGVRLVTRPTEFTTMVADLNPPHRNFDAFLLAWEATFRVDLTDTFHSTRVDGQVQWAGYANPEVDSLIERVAREPDRDRARPLLRRLQEIMRDEQPWTFLYYFPDLFIARDRLRDIDPDIRGLFVNVQRWWVPREDQDRTPSVAAPDDSEVQPLPPAPAPSQ